VRQSIAFEGKSQAHRVDLEGMVRERIREVLDSILEEEVEGVLGVGAYERAQGRKGYRHGYKPERSVVTSLGPVRIRQPRARLRGPDGGSVEFESQVVSRYQRRTRRVDGAILSYYLCGANTRKVKRALEPLVAGTALSRSAISRVVSRLKGEFEAWRQRDLSEEEVVMLVADAMRLGVRLARRVVKVPVQAVIGVLGDGRKVLLSLRIAPSESTATWQGVMEDLAARGLRSPILVVLDGNRGLVSTPIDSVRFPAIQGGPGVWWTSGIRTGDKPVPPMGGKKPKLEL
jgi:putative transposase